MVKVYLGGMVFAACIVAAEAQTGAAKVHPPVVFEPNQGQAPSRFHFITRGQGYMVGIADRSAVIAAAGHAWRMRLEGGASEARPAPLVGLDPLPGHSHHFRGRRRVVGVPQFGRVRQTAVYPGIDLVWHAAGRQLEYDFRVAPGADPAAIRIAFENAGQLSLDGGDLILSDGFRQPKPVLYQQTASGRREIAGGYRLRGQVVTFDVGGYDRTRELVIDPVLAWSAVVGGAADDVPNSLALDASGNIYITGRTASLDFPSVNPRQASSGGDSDVFVTKLNAAGTAVIYSTYLGGSGRDEGNGIAVDSDGNAYIAGSTESTNFPLQSPIQSTLGWTRDAFIAKLNAAGNTLLYSTYFGGGGSHDYATGIAVDGSGNAYVTGVTGGGLTPVGAFQPVHGGNEDAFVTKLNAAGAAHLYTTYLGGSAQDRALGIALAPGGLATIVGATTSDNFPLMNPKQGSRTSSFEAAFVSRLNAAGNGLVFSTYLSGTGTQQQANSVAVGSTGNTYVVGETYSSDFPMQNATQPTPGGLRDAFVTAYNSTGTGYLFSTYLGGAGSDSGRSIAIDAAGAPVVAGETESANFPLSGSLRPPATAHIYRSADAGATWSASGFPNSSVVAIAADPTDPNIAYLATSAQIHKTTNGGASWSLVLSAPTAISFNSLAIDPTAPCTIYAGLTGYYIAVPFSGVQLHGPTATRSTNCGASWVSASIADEYYRSHMTVAPTAPSTAYWLHGSASLGQFNIVTTLPKICRGPNLGTFSCSSFAFNISALAIDPANPCTSTLGKSTGEVSRNTSCASLTYSDLGTLPSGVFSLAHHPTDGQTLFAGLGNGQVHKKTGAGAWTLAASLDGKVNALAFAPSNGSILYAGTGSGSIYKSTDGGLTFTRLSYNGPAVRVLAINSSNGAFSAGSLLADAFVTQFTTGGAIQFSTLHGAADADTARGVALRSGGEIVIAGNTASGNYPITGGGYGANHIGRIDGFVARIDPLTCSYTLNPTSAAPPAAGGAASTGVTAPTGCAWTAASNAAWITVTSGASGSGNGVVNYSVAANPGATPRAGTIAIGGQAFTVNQAGIACTYSLNPTSASPGASGGAASTGVTAPTGCAWTAVSNAAWITITSGASGAGNGTVNYTVAANSVATQRTGTISIGGQTFTVNQAGVACTYFLNPTSASPNSAGGAASTGVTAPTGCAWTAVSNAAWIAITSGAAGSGSGTINYTVAANPAAQRTGSITVAGLAFTIAQAGAGANATPTVGDPSPSSGSGTSRTFTFTFSDGNGASDLAVLNILINGAIDGRSSCYLAYVPSGPTTGTLYLVNDAGDAGGPFAGALAIPSTGTISNSQCTIGGVGSAASMSGTALAMVLNIGFSTAYRGNQLLYLAARDAAGNNSGWRAKGVWNVPGAAAAPVTVVSFAPERSVTNSVTLTGQFSDTAGFANLDVVNFLISDAIDGRHACYIAFVRSSATVFLVNDAGDAGGPFAGGAGIPGSGSASNSQCTVNALGSSAIGVGNVLTLSLNIAFTGSFAGDRVVYVAARNLSGNNTGWQASGTITVP